MCIARSGIKDHCLGIVLFKLEPHPGLSLQRAQIRHDMVGIPRCPGFGFERARYHPVIPHDQKLRLRQHTGRDVATPNIKQRGGEFLGYGIGIVTGIAVVARRHDFVEARIGAPTCPAPTHEHNVKLLVSAREAIVGNIGLGVLLLGE